MGRIFTFILITVLLTACSESDQLTLSSTYEGIFYRIHPQARTITSDVTLELTDGGFSGTTSVINYPAICNGTYTLEGNTINFSNGCAFTADFDWSYILQGNYEIDDTGDYIYFIQEVDTDIYNVFRFPGED